jgi:putative Mg2+ transporter-C (MgtC) family protein
MATFFGPKIFYAALCGGIVGFERELKHKSAGMTTMMLMSIGSTLFVAITVLLADQNAITHLSGGAVYDPARTIAQIVSGTGFLCAGVIFKTNDGISGLTTSSLIWLVCALGVLVGCGGGLFAVTTTLFLVSLVYFIKKLEKKIIKRDGNN